MLIKLLCTQKNVADFWKFEKDDFKQHILEMFMHVLMYDTIAMLFISCEKI